MPDQSGKIGTLTIRLVDIVDDLEDCVGGPAKEIQGIGLEPFRLFVDAPYPAIQRPCDGHATLDIGHVRAAVECMTGAVEFVRHLEGRIFALAGLYIVADDLHVASCLFRKDVEQHRIHFECR